MNINKLLNVVLILALCVLGYVTNNIDSGKKRLEIKLLVTESKIEKFHVEQSKVIEQYTNEIKLLTNKVKELNKEKVKISYYESGKVKEFSSDKLSLKDISATSSDIGNKINIDHNLNVIDSHKEDNKVIKQDIVKEESWYKKTSTLWAIFGIAVGGYVLSR